MSQHESGSLVDVIDHFVLAESREREDVAKEMQELAALYRNVMRKPLPEASPSFTTTERVEALRAMRHSLANDDSFDEDQAPVELAA